jgi:hypothetical protein
MASADRYITIDSAAFTDSFGQNNAFEFSNLVFPALDNRDYNLEMCVLDISLMGNQTIIPTCFDITCDLVEPYQKGDGLTQTILTFMPRGKSTYKTLVTNDHYPTTECIYFPLRETHSEFDHFTQITMKIQKTFGVWTHEQVEQLKTVFPDPPLDVDLQRVIIRLHVRKAERPSAKEAKSLFLKRI